MQCTYTHTRRVNRWSGWLSGPVIAIPMVLLGWVTPCLAVSHTLTITATHGSVVLYPDKVQYDEGEEVILIAKPEIGYHFTHWTGDTLGTRFLTNLVMNSDKVVVANFDTWKPPIGIPEPAFGIHERHTMYTGKTYDFGSGLEPYRDAGHGPYTHYVDSSSPNATDSGNPYGSPATPRDTIPRALPEGSVVEIHNSASPNGFGSSLIEGVGTAQKPIFVRGVGLPRLETGISIGYYGNARYIIVEGLDCFDGGIYGREAGTSFVTSHIAIRACDFSGNEDGGGTGIATWSSNLVRDIVYFGNIIHDNGLWDPLTAEGDQDNHAIAIGAGVSNVWIVDNETYHNSGNGVQVNAGSDGQSTTHHIYIGRNTSHHSKQGGFWTKQAVDVIMSENEVYGLRSSSSSPGTAMGFQYAPERVWFLYNRIHDCEYGISFSSDSGLGFGTESYCIGNLIYDIHYDPDYHDGDSYNPNTAWANAGIMAAGGVNRYFIGNTLYDVDAGFNIAGSGSAYFANNIISGVGSQGESHIWVEDEAGGLTWKADNNLLHQPSGTGRIKHYTTVYSASTLPVANGRDNINADPKFMTPGSDFRLRWDSPAIGAHTSTDTVKTIFDSFASRYGIDIRKDIQGRSRTEVWDIGAYEYTPDPITDLSVSDIGRNALTLAWTVPGQEGLSDLPGRYDIRYAKSVITEANWDAATQVLSGPKPGTYGDAQSFTLTELDGGTTYYVAIKAISLTGGAASALSNVVSGTTANSGNHAPVLQSIGDKALFQGQSLDFTISATDADAGDTLAYTAKGVPAGANFNAASQTFTWNPAAEQGGMYLVTFEVTDSHVVVSETILITVSQSQNHAPELTAIGDRNVNEGQALSFTVGGTDVDGGTLTFSAAPLPAGANFVSPLFSWVPTFSQAGNYSITFTVTDNGGLTDSEQITVTVNNVAPDLTVPSAHDFAPEAGAVQVPLNSLIALTLSDSGDGVDPNTVVIRVNNQVVYSGNTALYASAYGDCRRIGTPASYRYYYEADTLFDFNQEVSVRVDASDLAGNAMATSSYSFVTEMRSFGDNRIVSFPDDLNKGSPATARDSNGNIWVVFHAGPAGQRDIYISKRAATDREFAAPIQLTTDGADQSHPDIAVGADGQLYVVWQDDRQGNSDIYVRLSSDGATWSPERQVTDFDGDQTAPVIGVDTQATTHAYIAWQDNRAGHDDIYVADSDNGFQTSTVTRVTSNPSGQSRPAIALDASNVVYLLWVDNRNGSDDVYGAASDDGPWTNVPVVTGSGGQFAPALALESQGSIMHVLWTDDTGGDLDIYYGSSDGMPASSLIGRNLIDDTSNADQSAGAIVASGSAGARLNVFACWQDNRNVTAQGQDTDLYCAQIQTGNETNILIGDDGTGANQSEPVLGVDLYGYPYVVWTDDRDITAEIYHAGSTFIDPNAIDSQLIMAAAGGTVGVTPPTALEDVSVVIPAGVCLHDVTITIARVWNSLLPDWSSSILAYDFGPSGLQFTQPVTITIPYLAGDFPDNPPVPYWYDSQTSTLSQQGISNIQRLTISATLRAVRFRTTHFTPYALAEAYDGGGGGRSGGGGGGCALTPRGSSCSLDFLVPYLALAAVILCLKLRDRRSRRISNRPPV